MSSQKSYDDQFNDGLFRTTLNVSKLTRPGKWPKSVSEMRGNTTYDGQGMAGDRHDADHGRYAMAKAPRNQEKLRVAAYMPTPAQYMPNKQMAPTGKWQFNPVRNGWVWADAR